MNNLNDQSLSSLLFMYRYGDARFIINDGKIVGIEQEESPAPGSKRD